MKAGEKLIDSFEVAERVISRHNNIAYIHVLDVPKPPLLQERIQPGSLNQSALQQSCKRPKCTVLLSVHESVRWTRRQEWSRCSRATTP